MKPFRHANAAVALLAALLASPVLAAKIPGTVHPRGGETLQASDIRLDGLEERKGITFTIRDRDYQVQRSQIAALAFRRVNETRGGFIGPDSRIRITFTSGKTVIASNALLATQARITHQGDLVGQPRTRRFTINGSEEAAVSDPDDVVRIRFQR
ncbi:hypothetical protein [Thiohalorhabdus sp.]|uniref:hypothetical protein n=1 Tax=Thiohalorhabdus sp. TaxID=3094134 RepID=UPI002FC27A35